MPFGLANASAIFQAYINKALAGYVNMFCVIYLDDILIYSLSLEEHYEHIRKVLEWFRYYQLFASLKKYKFIINRMEFLGFIIFTEGISIDQKWVESIII